MRNARSRDATTTTFCASKSYGSYALFSELCKYFADKFVPEERFFYGLEWMTIYNAV